VSNSIWNTVKGQAKKASYASWPKPFNAISRIDVLNCHEVLLMRVEFVAEILGEMFWDAQVPSPRELFRNWVFGNLRCGKKMGVRPHLPGPGSLFLDRKGKVVLAEWGGILGAPLLYWSMAQTYFKALDTWSTIQNVTAMCENPEAHALMRDAHAFFKAIGVGSPVFAILVYDPFNWCDVLDNSIHPPEGKRMGWACGKATNTHPTITAQFGIEIKIDDDAPDHYTEYTVPPLGVIDWSVGWEENNNHILQIKVNNMVEIPGVLPHLEITVTRFMGVFGNEEDPNHSLINGPWEPFPDASPQCFSRFADGL